MFISYSEICVYIFFNSQPSAMCSDRSEYILISIKKDESLADDNASQLFLIFRRFSRDNIFSIFIYFFNVRFYLIREVKRRDENKKKNENTKL